MEFIDNLITGLAKDTQLKINELRALEEKKTLFLNKVKELYPVLVTTLAKQNLVIDKINPNLWGDNWMERESVCVGLHLKPANTKFKFIKEAGYTSSGSGKNRMRLNTRAMMLEDNIKAGLGIESVSANPYCFEYNSGEDTTNKTILVDFWINI